MNFLFYFTIFLFIFLCFLSCFVILIQESKSLGLGASFGGETGESVFGTSTADVLKRITAYFAIIFVISCVVLSIWTNTMARKQMRAAETIEEVQ